MEKPIQRDTGKKTRDQNGMHPPSCEMHCPRGLDVNATQERGVDQPTDGGPVGKPGLHLCVMHPKRFHHEAGQTESEENTKEPPVSPVVAQARFTRESAAIHREKTADAECDAEDVHRQLVNQIIPAVMKV